MCLARFNHFFFFVCRLLLIVCSIRLFSVCMCACVRWLLVIYSICLWKWFVITHLSCFNFKLRQKLDTQLFYYVWALSTFVQKIEKLRKVAISKQRLLSDEKLVSHVNNAHKIIIIFYSSTSCIETSVFSLSVHYFIHRRRHVGWHHHRRWPSTGEKEPKEKKKSSTRYELWVEQQDRSQHIAKYLITLRYHSERTKNIYSWEAKEPKQSHMALILVSF